MNRQSVELSSSDGLAEVLGRLLEAGAVEIVIRPARGVKRAAVVKPTNAELFTGWVRGNLVELSGRYLTTEDMRKRFNKCHKLGLTPTVFGKLAAGVFAELGHAHKRMAGSGNSGYMDLAFKDGGAE